MPNPTRKRLADLFRSLGSLLPRRPARRPHAPRVVQPGRDDARRGYPSVGLTPTRLLAYLQAADGGAPHTQFELFRDMLQKWPRLAAVEATRRLALTGLDYEILPAATPGADAALARATADHCEQVLAGLDRFPDVLGHLAHAIGYGLAVAELVWDRGRVIDLVPVPCTRLIADPHEPWRLRVLTDDDPTVGLALDEHPHKWIVHQPHAAPARPFEGGLLRASALLFLAQNVSFKDWLIYSQIAGVPVRVAQFEPGTPDADKHALLRMLESLGTDAVAVLSKNVELKFVETGRDGVRPYQPLQDYCNTEITILWLGQHLTTDIRASGSRAAAEIHDRVREDLLANDILAEGQTLRRDLLTPLVRARFGDGAPVPLFRRSLVQSVDTKALADVLAVAVNQLGLAVPRRWLHQTLGIPEPQTGEPTLTRGGAS